MFFIYFLQSINNLQKTYVGDTTDVQQRLETHNSGGSIHTKIHRPWKLVKHSVFTEQAKAKEFEKYLKSQSGRAFAKKRFW